MECICQVAAWWMELRLPLGSSMSFRCTAYQRGFAGSTEIIIQYEMYNASTWIFIFYYIWFPMWSWSLRQRALQFSLSYCCAFACLWVYIQLLHANWFSLGLNTNFTCIFRYWICTFNTFWQGRYITEFRGRVYKIILKGFLINT